ncbi:hypothetical protein [Sphingomonas sp. BK580]|uniref:hypothetical protein n=1 Tax=Sphingomonas sp. BK580 TaxID=2586972 RepID=UPI001606F967|nr:hypothetical protein [Sphingomonas sp. BK580]MBB3691549.1 hypothetical protein [Sphingomonas sp. BK580]
MAHHLSIRLFAGLFALSLLLSAAMVCQLTAATHFAFELPPEAAAMLMTRIQLIRVAGLGLALLLMVLVVFGASRSARGALAWRWLLSVATSLAFLRGAGLVAPLPEQDALLVGTSALQLGVEALAIVLLYGEDAAAWFGTER